MVKARCFKCGHAFHLSEQQIANALANEGLTRKPSHYTAECPRCRQAIKLPLKRVRLPDAEQGDEGQSDEGQSDEDQPTV
jgi:Zn ribbon nucleic-acid-binding protein